MFSADATERAVSGLHAGFVVVAGAVLSATVMLLCAVFSAWPHMDRLPLTAGPAVQAVTELVVAANPLPALLTFSGITFGLGSIVLEAVSRDLSKRRRSRWGRRVEVGRSEQTVLAAIGQRIFADGHLVVSGSVAIGSGWLLAAAVAAVWEPASVGRLLLLDAPMVGVLVAALEAMRRWPNLAGVIEVRISRLRFQLLRTRARLAVVSADVGSTRGLFVRVGICAVAVVVAYVAAAAGILLVFGELAELVPFLRSPRVGLALVLVVMTEISVLWAVSSMVYRPPLWGVPVSAASVLILLLGSFLALLIAGNLDRPLSVLFIAWTYAIAIIPPLVPAGGLWKQLRSEAGRRLASHERGLAREIDASEAERQRFVALRA